MSGWKPMSLALSLVMIVLVTAGSESAELNEVWAVRYNGPAMHLDVPNAIAADDDGNVYVTGYSLGVNTGYDFATVSYDSAGQERWVARYNGPADGLDMATAAAVDNRGNVYVTGYSCSSGNGSAYYDYVTIKYDSRGQEQWIAHFDGPSGGVDVATAVAAHADGSVCVTGYTAGQGGDNDWDFATVKYDHKGRVLWVAYFDGPGHGRDVPTSISMDQRGNVFVSGQWCGPGEGDETCTFGTVHYGRRGFQRGVLSDGVAPAWDETTHRTGMDRLGNVYVTGPTDASRPRRRDYSTRKETRASGTTRRALGLISQTRVAGLPDLVEFNLVKMLEGTIKSLARGREDLARERLGDYLRGIQSERRRGLRRDRADDLVQAAQNIMGEIEEHERERSRLFPRFRGWR